MTKQSKPVEGGTRKPIVTADQVDGIEGTEEEPEEEDRVVEIEKGKMDAIDAAPGNLAIELPCGHVDKDDNLHDTLIVGEMTGYEEDILAGKGPIIPRLNNIIGNCIVQFGNITDRFLIQRAVGQMTAPDRLAALIAIRRVSLGDVYTIKIDCPKCSERSEFKLNLAEIEIVKMNDPLNRHREHVLESGKAIKWHILSADDEEWLSDKQKKKEDIPTLAIMARVDSVDGEKVERDGKGFKAAKKQIKRLSMWERNEIRSLFRKVEGSVDTSVEFDCPACEHEWESQMDVSQPGFFFPSDS